LEPVSISESKYFLFTGKSVQALGVPLRTFKSLNASFKSGGTRRRSVKTRRQKRR
jgi:hypothetical protein